MKTLLLVESDGLTRDRMVSWLHRIADEMRVLSTSNGEEAARLLASHPVDILITSLVMPVMDGFELLKYVLTEHPGIEIVVLGETDMGRAGQALCAGGVCRFLSKPVADEDLIGVVRDILARPAKGRLTGLTLPGFLQLLNAEGRTCSLRIRALGHEGRVDISRGELINASCDGIEGKLALFETLDWVNPEIEVEELYGNAARLIDERLPSLLLEAALRHDERVSTVLAKARRPPVARPEPGPKELAGEAGTAESARELGPGRPMRDFSTFAAAPLQVDVAAAAKGLGAFMRLEGTLGAGIFQFETGRSLALVCRGRSRHFAEIGAETARAVREGMQKIGEEEIRASVCQFKLHGPRQFQLVRVVRCQPRLLLIFMGLVGTADPTAASDLLADCENAILASPSPPTGRSRRPG